MRRIVLGIPILVAFSLSACDNGMRAGPGGGRHGGRYLGIGTYPPGRLWAEQSGVPRPADAHAATIADDEQIIVVVDSNTGEVRQCGNLSGRCIAANPWSGTPAPVALARHAADVEPADANVAATADNAAAPAQR
jgi:hypothetical protein